MPNRQSTQNPTAMPSPKQDRVESDEEQPRFRALSDEQMGRWAQLIAAGEEQPPDDLEAGQDLALASCVRQLRRERLIDFIVRQIALEIHRSRSQTSKATAADTGQPVVPEEHTHDQAID